MAKTLTPTEKSKTWNTKTPPNIWLKDDIKTVFLDQQNISYEKHHIYYYISRNLGE